MVIAISIPESVRFIASVSIRETAFSLATRKPLIVPKSTPQRTIRTQAITQLSPLFINIVPTVADIAIIPTTERSISPSSRTQDNPPVRTPRTVAWTRILLSISEVKKTGSIIPITIMDTKRSIQTIFVSKKIKYFFNIATLVHFILTQSPNYLSLILIRSSDLRFSFLIS